MTLFTRAVARDFRMLFGRCLSGRPRGPAPPVRVAFTEGTRTVCATTTCGVTLTHSAQAAGEPDDLLVLPGNVLAEVEGGTDEPVTLDRPSRLRGVVRWPGGGRPRSLPVELLLPGKQHSIPSPPPLVPVPVRLLTAVHECGRSAARESGRYALSKVQLQGRTGRVVGTDGKIALVWKGLDFPFAEDVLVPAVPVFGAKPLARAAEVRIGRTPTHLVVAAGPWSVWLPVEAKAKYPDVASLLPRSSHTTAGIDARDAAELLRALAGLPGGDDDLRPVTLDADGVLRVRGRSEVGEVREVALARSPVSGPAVSVAVDRRMLARGLTLGSRTLKLTPDRPVVMEGDDFSLVAVQLDSALVVPPTLGRAEIATTESPVPPDPTDNPGEDRPMKPTETNGHAPPRGDPTDPLELAEELRAALAEAAAKAARLVAALRQGRRKKKVLSALMTNLKQLNLGGSP